MVYCERCPRGVVCLLSVRNVRVGILYTNGWGWAHWDGVQHSLPMCRGAPQVFPPNGKSCGARRHIGREWGRRVGGDWCGSLGHISGQRGTSPNFRPISVVAKWLDRL